MKGGLMGFPVIFEHVPRRYGTQFKVINQDGLLSPGYADLNIQDHVWYSGTRECS
jgi:hypothetical protein